MPFPDKIDEEVRKYKAWYGWDGAKVATMKQDSFCDIFGGKEKTHVGA